MVESVNVSIKGVCFILNENYQKSQLKCLLKTKLFAVPPACQYVFVLSKQYCCLVYRQLDKTILAIELQRQRNFPAEVAFEDLSSVRQKYGSAISIVHIVWLGLGQSLSLNSLSTPPPPHKLFRHFQTTCKANFRYAYIYELNY